MTTSIKCYTSTENQCLSRTRDTSSRHATAKSKSCSWFGRCKSEVSLSQDHIGKFGIVIKNRKEKGAYPQHWLLKSTVHQFIIKSVCFETRELAPGTARRDIMDLITRRHTQEVNKSPWHVFRPTTANTAHRRTAPPISSARKVMLAWKYKNWKQSLSVRAWKENTPKKCTTQMTIALRSKRVGFIELSSCRHWPIQPPLPLLVERETRNLQIRKGWLRSGVLQILIGFYILKFKKSTLNARINASSQ